MHSLTPRPLHVLVLALVLVLVLYGHVAAVSPPQVGASIVGASGVPETSALDTKDFERFGAALLRDDATDGLAAVARRSRRRGGDAFGASVPRVGASADDGRLGRGDERFRTGRAAAGPAEWSDGWRLVATAVGALGRGRSAHSLPFEPVGPAGHRRVVHGERGSLVVDLRRRHSGSRGGAQLVLPTQGGPLSPRETALWPPWGRPETAAPTCDRRVQPPCATAVCNRRVTAA